MGSEEATYDDLVASTSSLHVDRANHEVERFRVGLRITF